MTKRSQFSLRSLFIAMTLIAAIIALIAQYPGIALLFLIFLPFLLVAEGIKYVVIRLVKDVERRWPRRTAFGYSIIGTGSLVGAIVIASCHAEPHDQVFKWMFGGLCFLFGPVMYERAWIISRKGSLEAALDGTDAMQSDP